MRCLGENFIDRVATALDSAVPADLIKGFHSLAHWRAALLPKFEVLL